MPDPQAPEIAALAERPYGRCPHCSYSATPNEIRGQDRKHFCPHSLECVRCGYRTETKATWVEAKTAWNTPLPIAPQETMREILKRARDKAKSWETNRTGLTENGHRYVREDIALAAIALGQSHSPATVERELVEALPVELCSDCPPANYGTDVTRCLPCPRRASQPVDGEGRKFSLKPGWLADDLKAATARVKQLSGCEQSTEQLTTPPEARKIILDALESFIGEEGLTPSILVRRDRQRMAERIEAALAAREGGAR